MLTFQTLYQRGIDITGVQSTSATDVNNIKQDINQGLRLFKNAARRYWTRKEHATALVSGQQYYQLAPDTVRVTEVRVNSNGLDFPVNGVDSEAMWNRINIIPAMTINLPMYYFIRGNNEIGLWPIPSQDVGAGLVVSYEPRLVDMVSDDLTTGTVTVVNGSTTVINQNGFFDPTLVGRWFTINNGSDGNWYQVGAFNSQSSIELTNYFVGISGDYTNYVIGPVPDIPEDYQLGLVYYAAYNFFLKRKDEATAINYKALFEDLLNQYREVYAAKTTGQIQQSIDDYRYSIFTLPPNPIT